MKKLAILIVLALVLALTLQGGTDTPGPGELIEVRQLLASDAQADDTFGRGVALGAAATTVGAPAADAGASNAGAAYVFGEPASVGGGPATSGNSAAPLESPGWPGTNTGMLAIVAVVFAATFALGGAYDLLVSNTSDKGHTSEQTFPGTALPGFVKRYVGTAGGIAELPQVAGTPLATTGSFGAGWRLLVAAVGATAFGAYALGGAASYAWRRWV